MSASPPPVIPMDDSARLKQLLNALLAANQGDFGISLPVSGEGGMLDEISRAFNELNSRHEQMAQEILRVERVVGREGRMTERARWPARCGGWQVKLDAINALIGDLVQPTTEVARVISAVAEGDLTQKMALEIEGQPVKGEFLRIGTTVNAHGRSAAVVRRGSHARRQGGRHRRQAGRAGRACPTPPAPGATSPTTSTCWPTT